VGSLSRTRRGNFEPLVEATSGGVLTGLTDIVSHAPQAFPAVDAAAMTYLAKRASGSAEDRARRSRRLRQRSAINHSRGGWQFRHGTLGTARETTVDRPPRQSASPGASGAAR
jgi:hypothetical protein